MTETVTRTAPAEESAEPTEDTSSDGSSASPEAPQQEETENLTSRGNIPKQVGKGARLIAPSGRDALTFTVTGLEPDYTCTAVRAADSADTADSEETYFVRLDITASGGSAEDNDEPFGTRTAPFRGSDWTFVDSSGRAVEESETTRSRLCLQDDEMMPSEIAPGEHISRSIAFEIPDTSGTLTLHAAPRFRRVGVELLSRFVVDAAEEQAAAAVRTAHGDARAMDPSLVGEAVDTMLNNMRIHAATSKI